MATHQIKQVIQLCRTALGPEQPITDGQLLESFITRKDPEAFEMLVRRHGPMVLSVCRRLLRNHHDAEDVFQAVFLVLARKATTIKPRAMVGNWLHGVAQQTAQKANAMNTRRRAREKQVKQIPELATVNADPWRDLEPVLDRELSHLPEKYRLPIVLCDLEGKSIQEATRQLGWPQGTLAGRLSRGRTLLAKRLAAHGVVLSGGSLAVLLSQNAASGAMPLSLVTSTVKTANLVVAGRVMGGLMPPKVLALTEGVMKAMLLTKLRSLTTVLCLLALCAAGMGALAYTAVANGQSEAPPTDKDKESAPVTDSTDVTIKAQGNRLVVDLVKNREKHRVYAAVATYQKSKGMLILAGDADNPLVLETKEKRITLTGGSVKVTRDRIAVLPDGTRPEGMTVQEAPVGADPINDGVATPAVPVAPPAPLPAVRPQPLPDEKAIAGTWQVVDVEMEGARLSEKGDDKSKQMLKKRKLVVSNGEMEGLFGLVASVARKQVVRKGPHGVVEESVPGRHETALPADDVDEVAYKLNPSAQPKRIDLVLNSAQRVKGIYFLRGDTLVIGIKDGNGRPDDFRTADDSRLIVVTFRRQSAKPAPPAMVGQIIVVGNEKTSQSLILKQIKLLPGQVIDYAALRKAEQNLEALNRFVVDPKKGIWPTVTVIDPDSNSPYKDILVRVQEREEARGKQPDEKSAKPIRPKENPTSTDEAKPNLQSSEPGWLRRAPFWLDQKVTYVLESNNGRPLMYVTPPPGVNLEVFVGRKVEISGSLIYRGDIKSYWMHASQVSPVPLVETAPVNP